MASSKISGGVVKIHSICEEVYDDFVEHTCDEDRREGSLIVPVPFETALRDTMESSGFQRAMYLWKDGKKPIPICIFGVSQSADMPNLWHPWQITTRQALKSLTYKKHTLEFAPTYLEAQCIYAKTHSPPDCDVFLMNWAHAENVRALRFIRDIAGYTMSEKPEPYGTYGALFYRFWKGPF